MKEINPLHTFDFQITANKLIITWQGKIIKMVKNKEAEKYRKRLEGKSPEEVQLILAKLTGNFKRGNE